MRDAVAQLKEVYGADAVIIATRRGQEDGRGFVEITARPAEGKPAPRPASSRGVSAYAQNTPSAKPPARPAPAPAWGTPAASAQDQGPFVERARWLSQQLNHEPQAQRTPDPKPALPAPQAQPQPRPQLQSDFNAWGRPQARHGDDQLAGLRAVRAGDEVAALRDDLTSLRQDLDALRPNVVTEETLNRLMLAMTQTLSAQIQEAVGQRGPSPAVEALLDFGLSRQDAEALAPQLGSRPEAHLLATRLGEGIECANPLSGQGQRRLAFVGPTGVGKTTTIAKIAARARILLKIPVALVTVDTFRIAAVEQLARYAEILDCPLRVVKDPSQLPRVLEELSDYPLVLVDTTGRNPRAADQVEALAEYLPAGWGGEVILTLAANMRESDLFDALKAFERLGPSGLCVTKLDETRALGVLYSLARRARRPLTWVTDGQRVPEDIEEATPQGLAARLRVAFERMTPLYHAS